MRLSNTLSFDALIEELVKVTSTTAVTTQPSLDPDASVDSSLIDTAATN